MSSNPKSPKIFKCPKKKDKGVANDTSMQTTPKDTNADWLNNYKKAYKKKLYKRSVEKENKVYVVTKETQRRIAKDVARIYKNPLNDQGIYYIHDDDDMMNGYAMLIGPEGTPYADGFYFFHLKFPYDYPYSPPVLKFITRDYKNNTRFNPNLYIPGKVCLSVLNTWRGPGWTSCQTISTVLLTLISILNENPMINEPSIDEKNPQVKIYNQIIEYRNLEVALLTNLNEVKNRLPTKCYPFNQIMKKCLESNYQKIYERIVDLCENTEKKEVYCQFFEMKCLLDYEPIKNEYLEYCTYNNLSVEVGDGGKQKITKTQ